VAEVSPSPSADRFSGRRALVTGSAMGIGRATALRLAAEGAAVGLLDVDPAVKETAALVVEAGGTAHAVQGSVASTGEVDAAVAEIVGVLGGLDVLANVAGITRSPEGAVGQPSELADMTDDEWDAVHEVNLKGTFRVTRSAMPHLRVNGGAVVCFSSIIGPQQGWATRTHYAASKAGVEGFVRALAVEAARDGIRVVGVAPGLVESSQTLDSAGPAALREWAASIVPIGHIAQPEDLASLVAFLASDEASYLTGVIITADGGMGVRSVNPLPERAAVGAAADSTGGGS
jgi:3-oxoacyl-[acyl-carrier protein] reductase